MTNDDEFPAAPPASVSPDTDPGVSRGVSDPPAPKSLIWVGLAASVAVLLVAVGVLVAALKRSDSPEAVDSPTTTAVQASTPATSAAPTATVARWTADQQRAMDAYLAFVYVYRRAAEKSDPSGFRAVATGAALREAEALMQSRASAGLAVRKSGRNINRIEPVSISIENDGSATNVTCEVNDDVIFHVSDGRVLNDRVATHRYEVHLVSEGGDLKVSAIGLVDSWSGVEMQKCVDDLP